jgi:hypothetical protein
MQIAIAEPTTKTEEKATRVIEDGSIKSVFARVI